MDFYFLECVLVSPKERMKAHQFRGICQVVVQGAEPHIDRF